MKRIKVPHITYAASLRDLNAAMLLMRALERHAPVASFPLAHFFDEEDCGRYEFAGKEKSDRRVRFWRWLSRLPWRLFYTDRDKGLFFDPSFFGYDANARISAFRPDIIHLHWIAMSCLSLRRLGKLRTPVVWTLHDVWPLTAGCHANMGCDEWLRGCRNCPQAGRPRAPAVERLLPGLTASIFKARQRWHRGIEALYPVSPSRWLGEMAAKSPLFAGRKISVIPNCIDTEVFSPGDPHEARRALHIPEGVRVIAFGATDMAIPYKGFDLLHTALHILKATGDEPIHLLVFGASALDGAVKTLFPSTRLGVVKARADMARVMRCADLLVCPSRQDNFPNVCLEAMACGVPVVGFRIGGVPELVRHRVSGYVAEPFDCAELAHGIRWILESRERCARLSAACRNIAESEYAMPVIAEQYFRLYRTVLEEAAARPAGERRVPPRRARTAHGRKGRPAWRRPPDERA